MRQAVLTCDRCNKQEWIPANTGADGWKLIMENDGRVTVDLCPECYEQTMTFPQAIASS